MVSSASAQIEATGGDHLKTTIVVDGVRQTVDDYARVQGILIGTVSAYIIFLTIIGPEYVVFSSLSTLQFSKLLCVGTTDRGLSSTVSPLRVAQIPALLIDTPIMTRNWAIRAQMRKLEDDMPVSAFVRRLCCWTLKEIPTLVLHLLYATRIYPLILFDQFSSPPVSDFRFCGSDTLLGCTI